MANVVLELDPGAAQVLAANFPAFTRTAGTNFPVAALAYDASAATDEAAFWSFRAINYASGNLTVDIDWYADTATSGDVIWDVQIAAITPNTDSQDVETKSLATVNSVTDTHMGSTGQRLHRCTVTVSNLDSLAAEDDVWMRVARDGNNASDTLAGDALIAKVTVTYLST